MKKLIIFQAIAVLIFLSAVSSFAQQDYQIVQNFISQEKQIEQSISSAQSQSDLDSAQSHINQLQASFLNNKDLLDKSLYPDNFNSSIQKLNDQLSLRKEDFGQVTNLQQQVSQMQTEIDSLNAKNAALLNQIEQIQEQNKKDVAKLERTIRDLRYSLLRRDRLVRSMLGSLIPPSYEKNGEISSSEKEKIYSKARRENLIANLKRSIDDNIKFLQVTSLNPRDLSTIRNQENSLEMMWVKSGPELIKIYSGRREQLKDITDIDSSFSSWKNAIDQQAWNSIRQKFVDHGIAMNSFSSGKEFTGTLTSFIDNQMKNVSGSDSKKNYQVFADSIWNTSIKPDWIPYLTSHNLLSEGNLGIIQAKISQWQSSIGSGGMVWLYIIIGVIIILAIIFLVRSKSSKGGGNPKTESA